MTSHGKLEFLISRAESIDAQSNQIKADRTSGGKPTSPGAVGTTAGLLISPGVEDVVSGVPPVQGEPGLLISPAYAGTLSAKATIAAVQRAFTDFIVGLLQVFSGW